MLCLYRPNLLLTMSFRNIRIIPQKILRKLPFSQGNHIHSLYSPAAEEERKVLVGTHRSKCGVSHHTNFKPLESPKFIHRLTNRPTFWKIGCEQNNKDIMQKLCYPHFSSFNINACTVKVYQQITDKNFNFRITIISIPKLSPEIDFLIKPFENI